MGETTFDDIEDLVADGLITLHMELNNVEEYLKNAQESKRLSKDSYGVGAGIDTSAVSTEKLEPLPPPLPPRYVCLQLCCLLVGYSLVCGYK